MQIVALEHLRIFRSASKISHDLLHFQAQKYDFIGHN
jgi:hypothetical protein